MLPDEYLAQLVLISQERLRVCASRVDCWVAMLWLNAVRILEERKASRDSVFVKYCATRCPDGACRQNMEALRHILLKELRQVRGRALLSGQGEVVPLSVVIPRIVLDSLLFIGAVVVAVLGLVWQAHSGLLHFFVGICLVALTSALAVVISVFYIVPYIYARVMRVVFDRFQLLLLFSILAIFLVDWIWAFFELHFPDHKRLKKVLFGVVIGIPILVGAYAIACIVVTALAEAGVKVTTATAVLVDKSGVLMIACCLAYAAAIFALSVSTLVFLVRAKDERRRFAAIRMCVILFVLLAGVCIKGVRMLWTMFGPEDSQDFVVEVTCWSAKCFALTYEKVSLGVFDCECAYFRLR